MDAILVRAVLAVAIAMAGLGLYWLANRAILARARRAQPGLDSLRPGVPAVLYFTTPFCTPCKTVQRPALARLVDRLGESVQVVEVDASARSDLAESWGVLSVPTTFIIDSSGRPRRVNHGVASAEKLAAQIEEVEGGSSRGRNWLAALRRWQDFASR